MHPKPRLNNCLLILLIFFLCACGTSQNLNPEGGRGVAQKTNQAATVNTQLGAGYLRRGQYQNALENLEKALSYDPNYATAHSTIAVLYEEINEINLAEKHHKRAVRLDPNNANAQNNLGAFLCKIGKYKEAEEYFANAAANPFYQTPEHALTNAGKCLLQIPERKLAESYFRKALDSEPNFADALYSLAEINLENGEHLRARAFLQRYEAVAIESPMSLLLGYRIEQALGSETEAELYAEKLKENYPNTPQASQLQRP